MTSEGKVCLGLADVKRYGVPYFGHSTIVQENSIPE